MGVVYKAQQIKANRIVALKMILVGGHASAADMERFRTEAHAIAGLNHPHVVQIYEVGEHDGLPYFSLEYCPNGSSQDHLNAIARIRPARFIVNERWKLGHRRSRTEKLITACRCVAQ